MIDAIKYQPAVLDQSWRRLIKGSVDFHEHWDIETDRCLNGYKPSGGSWIPGNYYFHINYGTVERLDRKIMRRRDMEPAYRDQDHEYFNEVNECMQAALKGEGHGLIVGKARRKGFSFNNAGIALHEFCFYAGSQVGIGSEVEKYVADFRQRVLKAYFNLPWQLRPRLLKNNNELLMSGYKEWDEDTQDYIEEGMKSMMHFRVMDPTGKNSAFRGLSLKICLFEEFGEWKSGRKHYHATEECFRSGAIQFGVPILGGTSEQISNESQDYMTMYLKSKEYNLKKVFIPASKNYDGYFNDKTGISDVAGATADIERRAQEKLATGDKLSYYSFRQEMPLEEAHMFLRSSATPFDLEKINNQIANLTIHKTLQIAEFANLDWPVDPKTGKQIKFGKPTLTYDIKGKYLVAARPLEGYANAHVASMDPYHIDDKFEEKVKVKSVEAKRPSKGCMMVYRRFIGIDVPGEFVVAEYTDRPESKEEFYENCAKLAIYYDVQVLGEYNDSGFFEYFEKNGLQRYLRERPRSADSPWSEVSNKYGLHMKEYQKNLAIEKIAEYVKHNCEDIYFVELLDELAHFGTKNTDRAMAFGMCLIHDTDNRHKVINQKAEDEKPKDFISYYTFDQQGNIQIVSSNSQSFEN